jgi:hypothetical protein
MSLEASEVRLQGTEKELFLIFIRKMLQWRPEDRGDIQDVFMDEWLLADLIESGEVVREKTKNSRGHQLHTSTKNPNQQGKVITVSVETIGVICLATYHAHEDGTFTQKITRAGEKAARAAAPLADGQK